jgi:hypothetical protein
MKRRSFLKGVAAAVLAPVVPVATAATMPSVLAVRTGGTGAVTLSGNLLVRGSTKINTDWYMQPYAIPLNPPEI